MASESAHKDRPRTTMLCLTLATGLAGSLISFALLRLHVTILWLRYGLSVTAAYAVFLGLICGWAKLHQGSSITTDRADRHSKTAGSDSLDWLTGLLDFDCDGILPVVLVLAAFVLVAAIFYTVSLIVSAPALLGEISMDVAAGARLSQGLRGASHANWLNSVFNRTKAPFFAYLVFFICAGIACHLYAPEASAIGGVIRHVRRS